MDDSIERSRATNLVNSYIVKAPAGSGKTTMLVNRLIRALAEVEQPEEILAITFTRKAAEEMRTRVLAILFEDETSKMMQDDLRSVVKKIKQRDSEKGWNLQANPSRLFIMTIDAFCAKIVRRVPSVSNLFTPAKIDDDYKNLYVQAARRALSEISSMEHGKSVSRVLWKYDSDWSRLEAQLAKMLEHRDLFFIEVGLGVTPSEIRERYTNLISSKLADCASALGEQNQKDLISLYNFSEANLDHNSAQSLEVFPTFDPSMLSTWKRIFDRLIVTKQGSLRKKVTVSNGFPLKGTDSDLMKGRWGKMMGRVAKSKKIINLLLEVQRLPPNALPDDELGDLMDVLKLFGLGAAHLNLIFAQRDAVDFTQLSLAAISALGTLEEPSDLALKLDYQIQHILVDEFQDTSPTQLELIRLLISGWTQGDGRSLFLVGDPMQSIYRFRKADMNLFNRLFGAGRIESVPLERLTLINNFRSQPSLVSWINKLIPASFEAIDSSPEFFVPQNGASKEDCLPPYKLYNLSDNTKISEAGLVADIVEEIQNEERDLDSSNNSSICVLARSKNHLIEITKVFKERKINFSSNELSSLAHLSVIQDILTLTRALLHPADRVGWYAFLRAPWAGLRLKTLATMSSSPLLRDFLVESTEDMSISKEELTRLRWLREVFLKVQVLLKTHSLCDVVKAGWSALGGDALHDNPESHGAVRKFLQLLERLDREGGLVTHQRIENLTESVFPDDPDSELVAVKIMTIHKAKGLEFDVVIIPSIHRTVKNESQSLLYWEDFEHDPYNRKPIIAASDNSSPDSLYNYLRDSESKKIKEEVVRVLYVALTRARKQVHLIGHLDVSAKNSTKLPIEGPKGSFLDLMSKTILADFLNSSRNAGVGSKKQYANKLRKIVFPEHPLKEISQDKELGPTLVDLVDLEFDWASILARQIGIVSHSIFQNLDGLIHAVPDEDLVANVMRYARIRFKSMGVPRKRMIAALRRTEEATRNILTSDRGRWLFSLSHSKVQCELEFFCREEDGNRKIVIDRTFVDKNNRRWVVDYKTGYHGGSNLEYFLDSEVIRHRPQLDYYARILSRGENRRIHLGLYFPMMDRWKEWPYQEVRNSKA